MQHTVISRANLGPTFDAMADHRLTMHPPASDTEVTRIMSQEEIRAALARCDEHEAAS